MHEAIRLVAAELIPRLHSSARPAHLYQARPHHFVAWANTKSRLTASLLRPMPTPVANCMASSSAATPEQLKQWCAAGRACMPCGGMCCHARWRLACCTHANPHSLPPPARTRGLHRFDAIDVHKRGFITSMELQNVLAKGGLNFSLATVAHIIRCVPPGSWPWLQQQWWRSVRALPDRLSAGTRFGGQRHNGAPFTPLPFPPLSTCPRLPIVNLLR